MAKLVKIDSNTSGLRYAKNTSIGVLPTAALQIWKPLEPNTYSSFGGQLTTVARRPINPSRQQKKGVVTDVSADLGFSTDLTQTNMQELLEGYFYAQFRRKDELVANGISIASVTSSGDDWLINNAELDTLALNAAGTGYSVNDIITLAGGTFKTAATIRVLTVSVGAIVTFAIETRGAYSVATTSFTQGAVSPAGGSGATFNTGVFRKIFNFDQLLTGALVFVTGLTDPANNGIHVLNADLATLTTVSTSDSLVDDTLNGNAAADMVVVGFEFTAGDAEIDASGTLPFLKTTTKDLRDLGLVEGEWIFIGGDATLEAFTTTTNNGFARIISIAQNALTFDKTSADMVTDSGGSQTIRIFFGRHLRNEQGTSIVRSTFDFERNLGANDDSDLTKQQAEYVVGGVPNEFVLNVASVSKITADLTFAGLHTDHIDENVSGANTLLSHAAVTAGSALNAPAVVEADAFNTSTNIPRIKLSVITAGVENPTPLFAFVTDLKFTIKNNLDPNKAVGVLGSFEVTAGLFEVGGSLTAYFSDVAAVQAAQDNADVTIDCHIVKANAGITLDIPLMSLGNAKPTVDIDKPITLPIDIIAASGAKVDAKLDYTASLTFYDYLPVLAE